MSADRGQVLWCPLGGTIQARGHDQYDIDRYHLTNTTYSPEQLLAVLGADVTPVAITTPRHCTGPSHNLQPDDVLRLVQDLRTKVAQTAPHGVVVTCGSNGLEELAYLIWLLWDMPVPIVVTASLRPPSALGSDAWDNLRDAITVARAREARSHGVLVVSDSSVLHPADAFKAHTTDPSAFRDSATPNGTITTDRQVHLRQPAKLAPTAATSVTGLPRVELTTSYLGSDGSAIRAATANGARGIVSAGLGAGFATSQEVQALLEARDAGLVVAQAARAPFGRVERSDPGFLVARGLTPQKARLALMVGIARGLDAAALQRLFDA